MPGVEQEGHAPGEDLPWDDICEHGLRGEGTVFDPCGDEDLPSKDRSGGYQAGACLEDLLRTGSLHLTFTLRY